MLIDQNILLIDKPSGITSFGVVSALRKKLGVKKIGHAGTLDPRATGLMIIGVGEGTKKLKEYVGLDKEYVAEILIGERRSTGDLDGEVVEEKEVAEISSLEISATLASMLGTLRLPVSAYSAMKRGGVPMYKRAYAAAKQGKRIEKVPIRDMEVHEAEFLGTEYHSEIKKCTVHVRFRVGSGTYVRSLAEELGKRLGYPATLKNLRRTKVGEFSVENAESV